ncbi:helix-turn-helix transcriptional regulator [Solirubrobacter phytolaccae]|uniref:Helix-turn-helix transcriptional regulator n=1 Tax=Solirubrobacter phytolaccae TaxID=1404360 RepID=A0A9X3N978_9ACTN|nr:helix-turn-helix transcriptional regulator [Solirubrobacter phytolaccae]MDA0182113.1 helix-turn-helix transcriptional regulator [Solirubrobacter phytolaccae]
MASKIGEFLRARRELVLPEDVGISVTTRRRVSGLRRDELALLAGISTEYYTRLEQGRDQHPSPQVLDALARALRLEEDATAHLHALAAPKPRPRRAERVRPSLVQLLAAWTETPAYVQGRHMDILAANALATAISPVFQPGRNLVHAAFLDAEFAALVDDHEAGVKRLVAALRANAGPDVEDPRLIELVGELSVRSDSFRRVWVRHDVRPLVGGGVHHMLHPQVGPLTLSFDKLRVAEAEDQTLVVYHAEPGSDSERALRLLGSVIA